MCHNQEMRESKLFCNCFLICFITWLPPGASTLHNKGTEIGQTRTNELRISAQPCLMSGEWIILGKGCRGHLVSRASQV